MDEQLRQALSRKADDFSMSSKAPAPVIRRARLRMAVVASAMAVAFAGAGIGIFFGASVLSDRTTPPPPQPPVERDVDECNWDPNGLPDTYTIEGRTLSGDVDGDGRPEEVSLRSDRERPLKCRNVLAVEGAEGTTTVRIKPLQWPGTDPILLLLAEIDGQPGVEPVVALSPDAVYQPGVVFVMRDGVLERTTVDQGWVSDLIPFYDEFPAGVDCTDARGQIVITTGGITDVDTHWDITRFFYRMEGTTFELLRQKMYRVEAGPEAEQRWPEVRGNPFRSCANRIQR